MNQHRPSQKTQIVLLSCPFCGHDPDIENLRDSLHPVTRDRSLWTFSCVDNEGGCNASVLADSEDAAIEAWNRRTPAGRGTPIAYLHDVVAEDGEQDQALSFTREDFPLSGVGGFKSVKVTPLVELSAIHCECPACNKGAIHDSDCSVHNMPASPNEPCDCGDATEGLPDLPKCAREMLGPSGEGFIPYFTADQMNAHYLKGYEAGRASHAAPTPAVDAVGGEPVAWSAQEDPQCREGGEACIDCLCRGECIAAASVASRAQTEPSEDTRRLDYLQRTGSTVDLVGFSNGGRTWKFRIGGLHRAVSEDIRAAIDIATLAAAPTQVAEAPKAVPQAVVGEASESHVFGKDCPVGKVQVEFVGCSPTLKQGEYGWRPTDRAFIEVYIDGKRIRIDVGDFHDGCGERRGLHLVHDFGFQVEKTSMNACSLYFSGIPSPAPSAAPQEAAGATGKQALQVAQEADALREALAECMDDLEYLLKAPDSAYARPDESTIAKGRAALAQHQAPQQGEQQ